MSVQADTPTAVPSLTISQLKVTSSNGQFVTLYNPTNSALNMSNYQLEYFNSFDLSKATSSKLVALSGTLPPHSYFMVSDGSLQLCYQMTVDSVSLGFSTTAGMIEVVGLNQPAPGSYVASNLQDSVGWSKTATGGAQTLPTNTNAFLLRQPVDSQNNPLVSAPGIGSWLPVQPDATNSCGLVTVSGAIPTPVMTGLNHLLPPTEPPATIVSQESSVASSVIFPPADVGLMSPQITELLPNPARTGTDATDEYIELYNPNETSFDLSGFALESGLTTLHDYTFAADTMMAPNSFMAFYAPDTKLTLSNTSGQVRLLDPFGNSISSSDQYDTAIDGQAYALANGTWSWTIQPTPGAANFIVRAAAKPKKSPTAARLRSKHASGIKSGTSVKKTRVAPVRSVKGATNASASIPIHPWVLALVGSLALLYGIYEYRYDLANHLRRCATKLGFGRGYWPKLTRWRSDRTGQ